MQPEIRTVPARRYVMVERKGFGEEGNRVAPEAVMVLYDYVARNDLLDKMDLRFGSVPDAMADLPAAEQRYQAGWFLKDGAVVPHEDGVLQDTLTGGRTAVFRHLGGYEGLGETWGAIFGGWLQASGQTPRAAQSYEVYTVMNNDDPALNVTEICVPIL